MTDSMNRTIDQLNEDHLFTPCFKVRRAKSPKRG